MATSSEKIARQIENLRLRVDAIAQTPQLGNSALDGTSIQVTDGAGQPTGVVGYQTDGSTGVLVQSGPTPPIPGVPTVTTAIGGIKVRLEQADAWADNQVGWVSPVVAPVDFLRFDIEVSSDPSFPVVGFGNVRGSFPSANGGEVFIAWETAGQNLYVRLRTRTTAGKFSDPGVTVGPTPSGKVNLGDLGFDINAYGGGTTIFYGSSAPLDDPVGTLTPGDVWLKLLGTSTGAPGHPPAGTPEYETYRWNGSVWGLLQDQGISASLAAAIAAQSTADSANALASTAKTTADGKITSYWQATAPVSGMSTGDFWLRNTDNQLYRYSGTAWVATQDTAIQTAITNAATAQSTANTANTAAGNAQTTANTANTAAGTAQATADLKVRVFTQPTAPTGMTAGDVNDVWINTSEGNARYVWTTVGTVERTNWASNPGFQYDASGTLVSGAPTQWAQTIGGTTGTVAASIDTSGTVGGTKRAKITGTTLSTLTTAWIGYQQTIPAIAGDILRLYARVANSVVSASQRPEWQVEWLNAAGGVISTLTDTAQTNFAATSTGRDITYTTAAAPALTVNARITIRRRGTLATGGTNVANADLMIDAAMFERNAPAAATAAYFDGTSGTNEAQWNGYANLSTSTEWERPTTTLAWQPQLLRSGSIQPKSLIASNVIATGTITAALLETLMVLTTNVIAGDPNANHTNMGPNGFSVFADDPVDGVPNEVIRLATTNQDAFLGIVNASGRLVSALDSSGGAVFENLTVNQWPIFKGKRLDTIFNETAPRGLLALGQLPQVGAPFTVETGIFEIRFNTEAGRAYRVTADNFAMYVEDAGAEAISRIRYTQDGSIPSPTSPILVDWGASPSAASRPVTVSYGANWYANDTTGTTRMLITAGRGAGTGRVIIPSYAPLVTLTVTDIGQATGFAQIASTGGGGAGGGATPAPQRVVVEYGAAWSTTYQGNNVARTDTTDAIQGYTPYYDVAGNMGALIGWGSLTGELSGATIEKVELWLYSNWWYYNAGGTAYIGSHNATASPATFEQGNPTNINANPGWLKGGGQWIDITNFGAGFANGTIRGISIGRAPDTSYGYYGRFDGAFGIQPPTLRLQYVK